MRWRAGREREWDRSGCTVGSSGIQRGAMWASSSGDDVSFLSLFSSFLSGSYSDNYLIRMKVTSQILKTVYLLSPLRRRPAAAHFAALSRHCPLYPNLVVLLAALPLRRSLSPAIYFFPRLIWRPDGFRPRQLASVPGQTAGLDLTSFIKDWGRSRGFKRLG